MEVIETPEAKERDHFHDENSKDVCTTVHLHRM